MPRALAKIPAIARGYIEIVVRIGSYRIVSEAGFGPLSNFFIGEDPSGKPVSIRSIQVAEVREPDVRSELAQGLRVAASMLPSLRHPNAESVLEVIDAASQFHVVSEPIDAPPFADAIHQDLAGRVAGLAQIAAALEQARRLGIVHGTVWPQHIFGRPGAASRLVLTQFMVARLLSRFLDPADPLAEGLRYSSPEQVQEAPLTAQSDQFSLAVIAYEWLTGSKPFEARQLPTVYFKICKDEPRPVTDLNPSIKPAANDVVLRALAKRPEHRYANTAAFIEALREALEIPAAPMPAIGRPADPPPTLPRAAKRDAQPSTGIEAGAPRRPETPRPAAPQLPIASPPPGWSEPEEPIAPRPRGRTPVDEPPVPPLILPPGSSPLANGRTIGVALVALLLIGGAIWVDRYRTPDQPIPVQQANPSEAPTVPPPKDDVGPDDASKPQSAAAPAPQPQAKEAAPPETKAAQPAPAPPPPPPPAAEPPSNEQPANQPAPARRTSAARTQPVVARSSSVRLLSIPPGAEIEVDESPGLDCIAPCTLDLPRGRHTLVARSPNSAAAHRIFNVPDDHEVTVVLQSRMGTLLVSSAPSGALVLVDGIDRGNTPASLRLTPGAHRLTVINGNRRADEVVQIESDQMVARSYRW